MPPVQYENPQVPEAVNLPQEHPLKDFAWMLAAVTGIAVIALTVLVLLTDFFIHYVPFELEQRLASSLEILPERQTEQHQKHQKLRQNQGDVTTPQRSDHKARQIEVYLQSLANELTIVKPLPDDMSITVHYQDDDLVNAFATLGGHVIIHRGLIEKLNSENALAMVMAHEIEHIRLRHPIRAAGRHIVIMLALASMAGFSDSGTIDRLVSAVGAISLLRFSRDQETQADALALETLQLHYGHAHGAEHLFQVLADEVESNALAEFLSTHPLSENRKTTIDQFIAKHDSSSNEITPLPALFQKNQKR